MSNTIPEADFEMIPLGFDEIIQATSNQELDFVISNPGMYVLLEADYGVNRLASLKNLRLGKPYVEFGAVIIAKADRNDIKELKDVKGKTFYWCPTHKAWGRHPASACKGIGHRMTNEDFQQAQQRANRERQQRLQLSQALQTISEETDSAN